MSIRDSFLKLQLKNLIFYLIDDKSDNLLFGSYIHRFLSPAFTIRVSSWKIQKKLVSDNLNGCYSLHRSMFNCYPLWKMLYVVGNKK